MIVSHTHRYIFLTPGTAAGTAIEIALSEFCGPEDIITPLGPQAERLRGSLGFRGPQNHLAAWYRYGPGDIARLCTRGELKPRFGEHTGAREARRLLPAEVWRSYFKFSVERKPTERAIASRRREPRSALAQLFRKRRTAGTRRRGDPASTIGGRLAVNRICRLQQLATDLDEIRRYLGLPEPLHLRGVRAGARERGHSEVIERGGVAHLFREEADLSGYRS